jgi:YidC/Oxa1 family membrane protein insertase
MPTADGCTITNAMIVTANIFQPLIDVFEAIIKLFHNAGAPWGLSIILLTVAIRAIMIPLTVKQFHSMRALQTLQPQMKEIQKKYKEDKQRQQQEMMKFYKENNVNPLASCLPMVAQLPVFISLFYMLRKNLRGDICPAVQRAANHGILSTAHTVPCGAHHGAGFLFISDLTNKATGATLIILLALYVGTQLGSTLMMSTPTMDQNQKRLMMFMPLIFVFIFIRYPAGLLVYWITTNTWTMAQQFVIRRRLGPVPVAPVSSGAGGSGTVAIGGGSGRSGGSSGAGSKRTPPKPKPKTSGNGSTPSNGDAKPAATTGLGGLRSKLKAPTPAPAATTGASSGNGRGASPPPPPRKKKKRSGKR